MPSPLAGSSSPTKRSRSLLVPSVSRTSSPKDSSPVPALPLPAARSPPQLSAARATRACGMAPHGGSTLCAPMPKVPAPLLSCAEEAGLQAEQQQPGAEHGPQPAAGGPADRRLRPGRELQVFQKQPEPCGLQLPCATSQLGPRFSRSTAQRREASAGAAGQRAARRGHRHAAGVELGHRAARGQRSAGHVQAGAPQVQGAPRAAHRRDYLGTAGATPSHCP